MVIEFYKKLLRLIVAEIIYNLSTLKFILKGKSEKLRFIQRQIIMEI